MTILLTILSILAGIIVLLLIIALFVKKNYTIEKEITILKSRQTVFNYIKFLTNQDQYNKWVMADPNVKQVYSGKDGTVGFIAKWDSEDKKVGKGEQEIKRLKEGERIEQEIRFIKPFEGTAQAYIATEHMSENQTRVKWGLSSGMRYPMNLMLPLLKLEDALGNDLQESLANLKRVLEKN